MRFFSVGTHLRRPKFWSGGLGTLLLAGSLFLTSCLESPVPEEEKTSSGGPLLIKPTDIKVPKSGAAKFSASGGSGDYNFKVISGTGTISSNGIYSPEGGSGQATIQVSDSAGATADATATILELLNFKSGAKGAPFGGTFQLTVEGGTDPIQYSIVSGNGSIDSSTGLYSAPVSGTPGETVKVKAVDSKKAEATADLILFDPFVATTPNSEIMIGELGTVLPDGGVPPYVFTVANGGSGTIDGAGVYSPGSTPGAIVIEAKDSFGNLANVSFNIFAPLSVTPSAAKVIVNGSAQFNGTGGIPPLTYAIQSGGGTVNASTGAYVAPATAGTAVVRVTDSKGHTSQGSITVLPPLTISPTSKTLAVLNTFSFNASGGASPYLFSIQSGSGTINSSTGLYSASVTPGSAVVAVTDSLGNTATSSITIVPSVSISPTTLNLAVNNSGNFTASNGLPPYSYSIQSGSGSVGAVTGAFTAPNTAGTTTVIVTDSLGNTSSALVTIHPALSLSPATLSLAANQTQNFSATGGVAPYSFSLQSGAGSINATTGAYIAPPTAGSAVVRVTDSLGNTATSNVTIINNLSLSPSTYTLAVSNSHTFSISGGTAPFTFSLQSGSGSINSSTGFYTAPVSPGTDVILATDSFGNTATSTVTIVANVAISPSNLTLAVNNSGSFSASDGVPPYSYSIQSGGGTIGSTTGAYTAPTSSGSAIVVVTDSLGNTSSSTVTINPALSLSPATANLVVNQVQNFTAAGGVSPYIYSLQSGTGTINSSTGVYTAPMVAENSVVLVTDSLGNTATSSIIITNDLSLSPTNYTLAVNNTYTFTATGGSAPRTFSILSGGGTINSTSGLYTAPATAGSAVIKVTDAGGASVTATVTINSALSLSPATVNLVVNQVQNYTASGGVTPYTYSLQSGSGSINSATGVYTAPASSGNAVVLVTDAVGNTATSSITILNLLTLSPTNYTLAVNNTYTFTATGGSAPHTFSIQSGGGTINSSSGLYTAPATAGSAVVKVTDSLGATSTSAVTINPALALSPASSNVSVGGSLTYSATGGVTPYTFSITTGGGSIDPSSGVYSAPATAEVVSIRVTDALGNISNASLSVDDILQISPLSPKVVADSVSTFSAVGGSGVYSFSIVSGAGSIDPISGDFTAPSVAGTTVIRVTDSLSSTSTTSVETYLPLVIDPTDVMIAASTTQNFSASGGYGTLTFSVFSGTGTINPTTGDFTAPAVAETDTVRVTDSLGNTASASVSVYAGLTISPATKILAANRNFTFTAAGGVPPLSFSIVSGGGTIDSVTGNYVADATAGSAVIEVRDSLDNTSLANITTVTPTKVVAAPQGSHTCAIFTGGHLKCWGNNANGQLGVGNTTNYGSGTGTLAMGDTLPWVTPLQISGVGRYVKDVALGANHTCAILDNDQLVCWGLNTQGQLGQGNNYTYGKTAVTTSCNATNLSCAMSQLAPINLGGQTTVKAVAAGANHTCVILMSDNSTRCFGDNSKGELGVNSTTNIGTSPAQMTALAAVGLGSGRYATQLALGDLHTCARLDNGTVRCWGNNSNGQLGVDSTVLYGNATTTGATCVTNKACAMSELLLLATVNLGQTVKKIAVGANLSCAILNDDSVKCWGKNTNGEIGQGNTRTYGNSTATTGTSRTITQVVALTGSSLGLGAGVTIQDIAVGYYATGTAGNVCIRSSNNKIKCWGGNSVFQAGIATGTAATTITKIGTVTTATSTAATMTSTGTGTTSYTNYTNVGTSVVPSSLAAGGGYGCVITNGQEVKCWGYNNKGQLGIQATTNLGSLGAQMGDTLLPIVFTGSR